MSEKTLWQLAKRLVDELKERGESCGFAESCTGGLLAKLITDVPGASAVLAGGFVTYTNEIKTALLGVDPQLLATETEVSVACAEAMARGARERLGVTYALSTTGYAGPGGGTDRDPVGTVYIALAAPTGVRCERLSAPASATREEIRAAAAERALSMLLSAVL